ncbi:MAG: GtrA family protein [Erysipelotrichaceae bacterium]|nr:GtrA family protein [Erysipelotrichaceae bacterium]
MFELIKKKFLNKQFLTFGLIGAMNTIGSVLIYMLFVSLGFDVAIASLLGDCLTMIASYFLNMRFTYHQPVSLKSFVTFPLSYVPGTLLNMIFTVILVDVLHAPKMIAKALALPITIPLNYITMSIIVKWSSKKK